MIKNISILVSMLLAFHINVGGADFPRCQNISLTGNYGELLHQCRVEECGYSQDPGLCAQFDFLHYGAVAAKTAIALLVFIILLIIIHIVKAVIEQAALEL